MVSSVSATKYLLLAEDNSFLASVALQLIKKICGSSVVVVLVRDGNEALKAALGQPF